MTARRVTALMALSLTLAVCGDDSSRTTDTRDDEDTGDTWVLDTSEDIEADSAGDDTAVSDTVVADSAEPDTSAGDASDDVEQTDTGGWEVGPVEPADLPATIDQRGSYLATHNICAQCHSSTTSSTAMRDAAGRPIGMYTLWRSTMMANASRDPFWRAMVSAEVARRPAAREAIEAKCLRCHAPALSAERELTDGAAPVMEDLADAAALDDNLGRDGVTCTVCHQIEPETLGTDASYDGGFVVNTRLEISAPHDQLSPGPMIPLSGYTPVTRDHMRDSGLCATCHTLRTATLDADGAPTGHTLVEQSPYLEWRNSAFQDEVDPGPKAASCQACHVPAYDEDGVLIETEVATAPNGFDYPLATPRSPIGRHLYVGGNTLLGSIFRDHAAKLNPDVPPAAFDATVTATRRQLQEATAVVTVLSASRDGDTLNVRARIDNLTGHKLPTGYPSRRLWLSLVARDSAGATVLASGRVDADGRLVDTNGDVLPSELPGGAPLPHRDVVTSPDDVVVYESIMADPAGAPTWSLMSAASYAKDNRLLPEGYSAVHEDAAATAPAGVDGDASFVGGSDEVSWALPLPSGAEVAEVEVSALYQPISARFAAELFAVRTEAVANFEWLYERADKAPELVSSDTRSL